MARAVAVIACPGLPIDPHPGARSWCRRPPSRGNVVGSRTHDQAWDPGEIDVAIRLLHAITSLESGGAQTMLLRLLEETSRAKFEPFVLGLMKPDPGRAGTVAPQVAALQVPIATLGMPRRSPTLASIWRLCRTVRAVGPDLLHGWMYHGNLAATIGSKALPDRPPVIWNVRHSIEDLTLEKRLTRWVIRLCARLSGLPRAIIYNSRVSAAQHRALGFHAEHAVVIPNGFDTGRFRPQPDGRAWLCRTLGIDPALTIVGMIARDHPMKDPGNLLRAVALLQARGGAAVHVVIAGDGLDQTNPELRALVRTSGLNSRVSLLGERNDVAALLAGVDIVALPSAWGEGFPNILGEAMACGVPCVATDVGDSTWVVGPHGLIVPPRQSEALADALARLIDLGADARRQLGLTGRARIVQHFSIQEVARQYEALHLQVGAAHAARRPWRAVTPSLCGSVGRSDR
jgi:glycosyltransferase involved in cell wall biosynthesis